MPRIAITVPDLGIDTEEMQFGAWLKEPGAVVAQDEDLFEVEADKATVICEAPAGGILAEVLITTGPVKMGDVLGYIDA